MSTKESDNPRLIGLGGQTAQSLGINTDANGDESIFVFHARFSPAKEVLHVLEEDVGPVPGRQAPLPLGVAAHRATGNQLINSMVGQGCTFQSEDYSSMCD